MNLRLAEGPLPASDFLLELFHAPVQRVNGVLGLCPFMLQCMWMLGLDVRGDCNATGLADCQSPLVSNWTSSGQKCAPARGWPV
ncbi:uncharacterized protein SPSK_10174 [Sporothrix schenckii 1099-18]|uniref:Uncharacterized protein n=1 Tax=Sporothrix schenckii 1099-18 TaxID=1397361 RepID=A0A0F2M643_SPOSC|nr:uncharacterized protein SPSK_10174 [Sporothrix schenckii 1099-18]KJR84275.1 hypothetical protein SPSK_10174 [Sporothrix schenckii 1099-18]